jgi:hypothetical protein
MKLKYAAGGSGVALLTAALYTLLVSNTGLRIVGVAFPRQAWLAAHPLQWQVGWWLWLVAIFGWMLLCVVMSWHYLPAHRVATMVQSGLLILAAGLAISGVIVWMAVLPVAFAQGAAANTLVPLVDALALGLIGAALMMAGSVTAWQALDLYAQKVLPRPWLFLPLLAGLTALPTPLLLPNPLLLYGTLICWLLWCGWLATRRELPSPFPEWPQS